MDFIRAPALMQPEPLLRMLAHPAFDCAGDCLHGAFDIDLAARGSRRCDGLGEFNAKPFVRQADDAHALDRAIDLAREARNDCAGARRTTEKSDVNPAAVVLIDQHAGDAAILQSLRQYEWSFGA